MLGLALAVFSAASFALNGALLRRGVLTGTVVHAVLISVPLGAVLFLVVVSAAGALPVLGDFTPPKLALLAASGILHFGIGRYCNFRATKVAGAVLIGPIVEGGMVWTIGLAVVLLGETITPLGLAGIVLIALGPMAVMLDRRTTPSTRGGFTPKYGEGALFAVLCSLCFGTSPLLVRMAMPEGAGLLHGLAGGFVAYAAATAVVLPLLASRSVRAEVGQGRQATRLFVAAGLTIWFSQLARYMALAIAPVSLVTPLQRTSIVFRLLFAAIVNPTTEVFSRGALIASLLCLAGVAALALNSVI
jgi:drug/metabolite transporter (DMT)-like permease